MAEPDELVLQAIAIVQALAYSDPLDSEGYACGLCLRPHNLPDTPAHTDDCLWARARAWDDEASNASDQADRRTGATVTFPCEHCGQPSETRYCDADCRRADKTGTGPKARQL